MLISWNWLKEYVKLDMPVETLTERLMMSGLNLEDFSDAGGDICIDLEVTSNRPDCLGHIGVAREVGVLFNRELTIPTAQPVVHSRAPQIDSVTSVKNDAADLCRKYTARVVRNVKVGPSPLWLQRRLATIGVRAINNIVDVTNYVMLECGQPLHAFDFDKLEGRKIIVRRAKAGEKITAIDQRVYNLDGEMCVIADGSRPVAVAGVMGGFDTEISAGTTTVLIEAAEFAPRTVRSTARKLELHSPSSYRFERGLDPETLDWASRRCAELIVETAGGELLNGCRVSGMESKAEPAPITLRYAQIRRVLGIDIPVPEVLRILTALGLKQQSANTEQCVFTPPSWRRDLEREIDLIEEVARIHGYERIPEDAPVTMAVSSRTLPDKVLDRASHVLTGTGFFEAVTLSFINEPQLQQFRPWDEADVPALRVEHSSRAVENQLRRSLVPSLLAARRHNERHGSFNAQLFEVARIYLQAEPTQPSAQPVLLSAVAGKSFGELKGVVEAIAHAVNHNAEVTAKPVQRREFAPGRGAELLLNGQRWGWLGEVSDDVRQAFELHDAVSVFEVEVARLEAVADLLPQFVDLPQFPGMDRDINLVLDETVPWSELEHTVRDTAGPLLADVTFTSQYRGQQIPAGKKSYVSRLLFRSNDRTLTADEVDAAMQKVLTACAEKLGAAQR